MGNRLLIALAALATVALVSCGAPSTSDFAKQAMKLDLYQMEAGRIASEKGQSEAVKQFGRAMVEAYSKASEELEGIVQAGKLEIKLPGKLDKRRQKWIDALNEATPEKFDRTYAQQQVKALRRGVELFDHYAEAGDNPALKQFAANTLPIIQQHLEQAKKLLP